MWKRCLALLALAISLTACSPDSQPVLRVSAIPDESPTELQRRFSPLKHYLETQTGRKVEFVPVADYAAVVEALASGQVDLAWLGGFTYVQAAQRSAVQPLVQRVEDESFRSRIIVNTASGIEDLSGLQGKTFAFGSVSSTSGHLMPRYFLSQQGIVPEAFFKRFAYSGAHDATAAWVMSGKVDGGALNAKVYEKLLATGKLDERKVKVIWTSPSYHDYNWTARADLPADLANKLRRAFLALDSANPAHQEILALQQASRFVATSPDNYREIAAAARAAGLL